MRSSFQRDNIKSDFLNLTFVADEYEINFDKLSEGEEEDQYTGKFRVRSRSVPARGSMEEASASRRSSSLENARKSRDNEGSRTRPSKRQSDSSKSEGSDSSYGTYRRSSPRGTRRSSSVPPRQGISMVFSDDLSLGPSENEELRTSLVSKRPSVASSQGGVVDRRSNARLSRISEENTSSISSGASQTEASEEWCTKSLVSRPLRGKKDSNMMEPQKMDVIVTAKECIGFESIPLVELRSCSSEGVRSHGSMNWIPGQTLHFDIPKDVNVELHLEVLPFAAPSVGQIDGRMMLDANEKHETVQLPDGVLGLQVRMKPSKQRSAKKGLTWHPEVEEGRTFAGGNRRNTPFQPLYRDSEARASTGRMSEPRFSQSKQSEPRMSEQRMSEGRLSQTGASSSATSMQLDLADMEGRQGPRNSEQRLSNGRISQAEARLSDGRISEPRLSQSLRSEPRMSEQRMSEGRMSPTGRLSEMRMSEPLGASSSATSMQLDLADMEGRQGPRNSEQRLSNGRMSQAEARLSDGRISEPRLSQSLRSEPRMSEQRMSEGRLLEGRQSKGSFSDSFPVHSETSPRLSATTNRASLADRRASARSERASLAGTVKMQQDPADASDSSFTENSVVPLARGRSSVEAQSGSMYSYAGSNKSPSSVSERPSTRSSRHVVRSHSQVQNASRGSRLSKRKARAVCRFTHPEAMDFCGLEITACPCPEAENVSGRDRSALLVLLEHAEKSVEMARRMKGSEGLCRLLAQLSSELVLQVGELRRGHVAGLQGEAIAAQILAHLVELLDTMVPCEEMSLSSLGNELKMGGEVRPQYTECLLESLRQALGAHGFLPQCIECLRGDFSPSLQEMKQLSLLGLRLALAWETPATVVRPVEVVIQQKGYEVLLETLIEENSRFKDGDHRALPQLALALEAIHIMLSTDQGLEQLCDMKGRQHARKASPLAAVAVDILELLAQEKKVSAAMKSALCAAVKVLALLLNAIPVAVAAATDQVVRALCQVISKETLWPRFVSALLQLVRAPPKPRIWLGSVDESVQIRQKLRQSLVRNKVPNMVAVAAKEMLEELLRHEEFSLVDGVSKAVAKRASQVIAAGAYYDSVEAFVSEVNGSNGPVDMEEMVDFRSAVDDLDGIPVRRRSTLTSALSNMRQAIFENCLMPQTRRRSRNM